MTPAKRSPWPRTATRVGTLALAAWLFVPAAVLWFSPAAAAEFRATGLPDVVRGCLAWPEMIGAVLLIIPRTCYAGAVVLVLDLAGAIYVHSLLGRGTFGLWVLIGAVLAAATARRWRGAA